MTTILTNIYHPPEYPRISLFYILPKIHKENIPGRPIVSSINSLTEHISEFLTLCIQPITENLNSYIKDTKHFLQKVITQPKVQKNTLLVSIDVKSLYTNIPHKEGIHACLHFIKKYKTTLPNFTPNNKILETLLTFVLDNNYFEFNERLYKQMFGTAMGTKMAPPYANLFLGHLENNFILNSNFKSNLQLYLRFLDDIFIIWKGEEQELNKFFEYINNIHNTIKFTWEYSKTSINFLDTTIYINKRTKRLCSKLYKKPTDKTSLLHFNSYHPLHTKLSIIYSQAVRYRTITTNNAILKNELKDLKTNLLSRKYPSYLINSQIQKIKNSTQKQYLYQTKRNKNIKTTTNRKRYSNKRNTYETNTLQKTKNKKLHKKNTLPFIVKYSEHFQILQKSISKYWDIFTKDKTLNNLFPNPPFISCKRHKNLKDLLTNTKYT